jgi:hypothetical protein
MQSLLDVRDYQAGRKLQKLRDVMPGAHHGAAFSYQTPVRDSLFH